MSSVWFENEEHLIWVSCFHFASNTEVKDHTLDSLPFVDDVLMLVDHINIALLLLARRDCDFLCKHEEWQAAGCGGRTGSLNVKKTWREFWLAVSQVSRQWQYPMWQIGVLPSKNTLPSTTLFETQPPKLKMNAKRFSPIVLLCYTDIKQRSNRTSLRFAGI